MYKFPFLCDECEWIVLLPTIDLNLFCCLILLQVMETAPGPCAYYPSYGYGQSYCNYTSPYITGQFVVEVGDPMPQCLLPSVWTASIPCLVISGQLSDTIKCSCCCKHPCEATGIWCRYKINKLLRNKWRVQYCTLVLPWWLEDQKGRGGKRRDASHIVF